MHLIPSEDVPEETPETINVNVFRNLDSPVSEGGDNFSTGCVPTGGVEIYHDSCWQTQRKTTSVHGKSDPKTFQGAGDGRGQHTSWRRRNVEV